MTGVFGPFRGYFVDLHSFAVIRCLRNWKKIDQVTVFVLKPLFF